MSGGTVRSERERKVWKKTLTQFYVLWPRETSDSNEPEIWIQNNLVEKLLLLLPVLDFTQHIFFNNSFALLLSGMLVVLRPPLKCNKMQILQFSILNTQFAVNSFPFDARGHQQISSQGIFTRNKNYDNRVERKAKSFSVFFTRAPATLSTISTNARRFRISSYVGNLFISWLRVVTNFKKRKHRKQRLCEWV